MRLEAGSWAVHEGMGDTSDVWPLGTQDLLLLNYQSYSVRRFLPQWLSSVDQVERARYLGFAFHCWEVFVAMNAQIQSILSPFVGLGMKPRTSKSRILTLNLKFVRAKWKDFQILSMAHLPPIPNFLISPSEAKPLGRFSISPAKTPSTSQQRSFSPKDMLEPMANCHTSDS